MSSQTNGEAKMGSQVIGEPSDLPALEVMKNASETVRSAIASAIPVATTQALTVSVPGTLLNYQNFVYNADDSIKTPLAVRVAEARLVDGMVPLSKYTTGKTGKSVARSYLATLDLLVPVEATVSGIISTDHPIPVDGRMKVVRDRYNKAMEYLKSPDDAPGANGRSKLATYVQKQENWAKAVEAYSYAQDRALHAFKPGPNPSAAEIKRSREEYLQWIQEHGRDFKHAIQARYMDWVVHGYKFMVDFNFGIVDISSGMKRVENSKEAFRNLTLIAEDGVSEYSSVILTPSNWATIVKEKVEAWDERNKNPTPSEIRAELRRLNNLLASHETLKEGIEARAIFPILSQVQASDNRELKKAYAQVYADVNKTNESALGLQPAKETLANWIETYGTSTQPSEPSPKLVDLYKNLIETQGKWTEENLKRNNTTIKTQEEGDIKWAVESINKKIKDLTDQITVLQSKLPGGGRAVSTLPILDERGATITEADIFAKPGLIGKSTGERPSSWTRVSCKVSTTTDTNQSGTSQSVTNQASNTVGNDPWSFWRTSTALSTSENSQSTAKAIASMKSLSVEISMDCMVVEIERPWLHAELFSDAELDSGKFDISPGEVKLKEMFEAGEVPRAEHQQFSSYPTAFVVAADIELSFSGDTSALENAVSASNDSANESIGYGPFSVSASRSQSKSSSKTKMESTATGCKISVQAPQIIGWVQTLLPQLPRDMTSPSRMVGLPY